MQQVMKELIEKVKAVLEENHLWGEVDQYLDLPVIEINISWGDWKHDHLACDWAIKESDLPLHKIGDQVTEEDGSDCFSAVHYYIVTA